jgi:hypothetical protein
VVNSLAYYNTELLTAVKRFYSTDPVVVATIPNFVIIKRFFIVKKGFLTNAQLDQ